MQVEPHILLKGREMGWRLVRVRLVGRVRGKSVRGNERERESAIILCIPGICCAEIVKLCMAVVRKRLRRRDMR